VAAWLPGGPFCQLFVAMRGRGELQTKATFFSRPLMVR
jgi:hypothetical protein